MSIVKTFPADDQARIDAAVAAVEQRTHAHFALMVVPATDRYALYPQLWSAVLALVAGGVMALGWPDLPLRTGIGLEILIFAVLSLIGDWRPLRLYLVPGRVKHRHAAQMAHRAFAARILANKEHRRGLLLFVALGEHYVEILAAPDIDALVEQDTWDAIVAAFVATAKSGRPTDGLTTAIAACGDILAAQYPREHAPPA